MVIHVEILTVVAGVAACLAVRDNLEAVALLACCLVDGSLHASVHPCALGGEKATWIPSVGVAEVADGCKFAYISQSHESDLTDQVHFPVGNVSVIHNLQK